ncbi:MAG: hypothetical protein AVDCRST_MAG49-1583 [uncultured Thermomicrobiales bacterium]|uniref:Uncharacterized protein n=1 Tax=uncultured Thermomicrobiales bacterium TaxID=1645740 RepID=A0A6J4UID1_9BACT|nr:MAG: hypothetical protein AVDCRST_MAG49-1583 [uncultured Thermomicrobiales bacterium]
MPGHTAAERTPRPSVHGRRPESPAEVAPRPPPRPLSSDRSRRRADLTSLRRRRPRSPRGPSAEPEDGDDEGQKGARRVLLTPGPERDGRGWGTGGENWQGGSVTWGDCPPPQGGAPRDRRGDAAASTGRRHRGLP